MIDLFILDKLILNFFIKLFTAPMFQFQTALIIWIISKVFLPDVKKEEVKAK